MASAAEPPPMTLIRLMTGHWVAQAIFAVAALDVAGAIVGGARTSDELASRCGANASALHRVMRALAGVGVFEHQPPDSWRLGPLGELLRTDQPGSLRPMALMFGDEQYRAWGDVVHSVTTGEPAFPHVFGVDYFEYLAEHPQTGEVFNAAMTGVSVQLISAVTEAYDFSRFDTVADIGGGHGALLTAILHAAPAARGILFDQPHVVADAGIDSSVVPERCTTVGGDFFVDVPGGADAYVMAQILHDWDDARAVEILSCCRRSMAADATLLVVDFVIPEVGAEPNYGTWLDLHMLVLFGSRERTAPEFADLLGRAGFELTRIIPTLAGPSVVEARPC